MNIIEIIKKVDRKKIRRILEELNKRDEHLKGAQPELSLGCFYNLNIENTERCAMCRNYKTCYDYIKSFEIKNYPV